MIRPAVSDAAYRLREVIAAGLAATFGLWLVWLGGYVLFPLGFAILAVAAAWGVTALRRVRFAQEVAAPGMVEVDEGQVGYLGPTFGGYVALPDLVELRLVTMHGRRLWRLKQADAQTLLIPVDAAGAERLFDAFASLPGMDIAALVDAADAPQVAGREGLPARQGDGPAAQPAMRLIWRRQRAIAPR